MFGARSATASAELHSRTITLRQRRRVSAINRWLFNIDLDDSLGMKRLDSSEDLYTLGFVLMVVQEDMIASDSCDRWWPARLLSLILDDAFADELGRQIPWIGIDNWSTNHGKWISKISWGTLDYRNARRKRVLQSIIPWTLRKYTVEENNVCNAVRRQCMNLHIELRSEILPQRRVRNVCVCLLPPAIHAAASLKVLKFARCFELQMP